MNRNPAIDIAKALVIISVVLGHVLETRVLKETGGHLTEISYLGIYLFHMPFFFLLSGWLFKEPVPTGVFFRKKFLHLMFPYIAWLLVFNLKAMAGFCVNLMRGSMDAEKWQFYVDHFSSQIYGGLAVGGVQMILWFPACLFFTQQLANWMMRRVPEIRGQIAVAALCYVLGYLNQFSFPGFHLPLALNVVAGAIPFFFLGHWLKKSPKIQGPRIAVSVLAVALVGIAIWNLPLAFHMRMAGYGVPIVSTIAAIGGFLLILSLSKQLARQSVAIRILQPIGDASMTIMYIHAVVLVQMGSRGISSPWLLLIFGVFIPMIIHIAFSRVGVLRRAFLGLPSRSPRFVSTKSQHT
jgi:fucose 4-O-acetylase-like acetyltransferase